MKKRILFVLILLLLSITQAQELVPNTAPRLNKIPELFVCEGGKLDYPLNATDTGPLDFSINKKEIFFIGEGTQEILSDTLKKEQVGVHKRTIAVSDGEYTDTQDIKITVIGINNPPKIEKFGVQTITTKVGNDYKRAVQVSDIEDSINETGKLRFNVDVIGNEDFIKINKQGILEFIPSEQEPGIYTVEVCVSDSPISKIHSQIEVLCDQDGSSQTSCMQYELSLVEENRPPTIIVETPLNNKLDAKEGQELLFKISAFDPDGTTPDIYWSVDRKNVLRTSNDFAFTHTMGCNSTGLHTVGAEITDGILNDTIEWTVNVTEGACTPNKKSCEPAWICSPWSLCQNTERSKKVGVISEEDFRQIKTLCDVNSWNSEICGLQLRNCVDINSCNETTPKQIQQCSTLFESSCTDNIKNCHDDSCELAVDCGGPCDACATCSDEIQNQGEGGKDCGFPCTNECPVGEKFIENRTVRYLMYGLSLILILFTILKINKIIKIKKELIKNNITENRENQ